MYAAASGHIEVGTLLHGYGVNIHLKNKLGKTCF